MNFSDLEQIIAYLEEEVTCPTCEHGYKAEQLNIMGVTPDEVLFYTSCKKCKTQVVINVNMTPDKNKAEAITENLQVQTRTAKGISQDDFLDMKNFLERFNGDFQTLFS